MGKLNRFISSVLLALALSSQAFGVIAETDLQKFPFRNLLINPGAESGKAGATASSGTFTITTTSSQILTGSAAFSWDASANGQFLAFTTEGYGGTQNAIPPGWYGKNGVASCAFKAASGIAAHKIQAYDGSNVIGERTIDSSTSTFLRSTLNFIFPSSGNLQLRIASTQDEVALYVDGCVFGLAENYNIAAVSQSYRYGGVSYATGGSWSTHAGAASDFTYSGTATADGLVTAASGNKFGPTIVAREPGNYKITWMFNNSSPNAANCEWTVYDGTSTYRGVNVAVNATTIVPVTVVYNWKSTGGQTKTFNLRGARLSGSGNCTGYESGNGPAVDVEFFPSTENVIYRPELNFYEWSGTASGTGTTTSTSGSGVALTGSAPTVATLTSTNLTCVAGSAAQSISCPFTKTGTYEVCADGSLQAGATGQTLRTWLAGASATIGNNVLANLANTYSGGFSLCRNYAVSAVGSVQFQLYGSVDTGTGTWGPATWRVRALTNGVPQPILTGGVSSNATNNLRVEYAFGTCSGSSSIGTSSSSWVTSGNVSSGQCALTFSPAWTAKPSCVVNQDAISSSAVTVGLRTAVSTTGVTIWGFNTASGSNTASYDWHLFCIGPK